MVTNSRCFKENTISQIFESQCSPPLLNENSQQNNILIYIIDFTYYNILVLFYN